MIENQVLDDKLISLFLNSKDLLNFENKKIIYVDENKNKFVINPKYILNIIANDYKMSINTRLINLCRKFKINLFIKNKFEILEINLFNKTNVFLKQVKYFEKNSIEIIKEILLNKIDSQINHLNKLDFKENKKYPEFLNLVEEIKIEINKIEYFDEIIRNKLLGFEGFTSKIYYGFIKNKIDKKLYFSTRQRNAKDPYNVCLNYMYGILYNEIEKILKLNSIDIYYGIYHTIQKNKKSFLYDFVEQFRYIVFENVYRILSQKILSLNDFIIEKNQCFLTHKTLDILVSEFYVSFAKEKIKIKEKAEILIKKIKT